MKPLITLVLLSLLMFASCKKGYLNSATIPVVHSPDPKGHASVTGVWTWSAQYSFQYPAPPNYYLNPANTHINETLTLGDSIWTQNQNGTVVNSGVYHIINVITPGGSNVFIKFTNSQASNQALNDNFDFKNGFSGSYAATGDSLIFYGVYDLNNITGLASERVYVK